MPSAQEAAKAEGQLTTIALVLIPLVALAVGAWWQGRQDAAMERVYLRQLTADLRETVRAGQEAG